MRCVRPAMQLLVTAVATALIATSTAYAQLSKPFLWELTKDAAKDAPKDAAKDSKTVVLFGSLHVAKPDFYPVPDSVQKRFDDAKVLAVEADVTLPETQQACTRLAVTKEKLESVLSAEDFAALSGYSRAAAIPDLAHVVVSRQLLALAPLGGADRDHLARRRPAARRGPHRPALRPRHPAVRAHFGG